MAAGERQGPDTMPASVYAREVVAQSLWGRVPREIMLEGKMVLTLLMILLPRTVALCMFWWFFTKNTPVGVRSGSAPRYE